MSNTDATHCKSCGAKLRITQTRVFSWRTRRTRVCPTIGCKASVRETSEIPDSLMNYLLQRAGVEWDKLAQEWVDARSAPASQPDIVEPVADYAAAIRADIEENKRLKEESDGERESRESRERQIAAMKNNRRDPDGSWRDPEGNIVGYWRDE